MLQAFREQFSSPLDPAISYAVKVLRDAGIETYESCSGEAGHSLPEATVRFFGGQDAGLKAVAVAIRSGLPVLNLRRFWTVRNGELIGPDWELTFFPLDKLKQITEWAEQEKEPGPHEEGRT